MFELQSSVYKSDVTKKQVFLAWEVKQLKWISLMDNPEVGEILGEFLQIHMRAKNVCTVVACLVLCESWNVWMCVFSIRLVCVVVVMSVAGHPL